MDDSLKGDPWAHRQLTGPGGRDETPARRLGEPDGEVPWEPVITRPDPMTAEEWRAELECEPAGWTDPEEYPVEEDYLDPEVLDLTDAELAEIAAATRVQAANDADPAGVADVLAAQAAAASARR